MVDLTHPAAFFARARAHRPESLGYLQLLPASIEPAAHGALVAPVAKEAMAGASHMHHGGHLHAQVDPHAALTRQRVRRGECIRHVCYPLAPLALDTQTTRLAQRLNGATADDDLAYLPVLADRDGEATALDAPVLVVPLADGLAQHRNHAQLERAPPDRAGIAEGLVLDGPRQRGGEVLGAGILASLRQHVAVEGLHQHIDRADVLLCSARAGGAPAPAWDRAGPAPWSAPRSSSPHVLDCLSM